MGRGELGQDNQPKESGLTKMTNRAQLDYCALLVLSV